MNRAKTKNCKHSSSNVNMSNFRETRETLLYAHFNNVIDEEEFLFLFYLNSSKIPDIKYWKYHTVDLNSYDDDVVSQILIYKKRLIFDLLSFLQ